ncbi:MAG: DNA mismatch repair protein MutS [Crocinitomicaceae bacterium]|nr:DNA mismatch repair protein MutS [Crocinitomicaceae bacterium]
MDPKSYFESTIDRNASVLSRLKKTSLVLSMARLIVFIAAILVIYFFWGNTTVTATAAIVGFGGFLFLVARYTDVKAKRDFHQKIKDINDLELRVMLGHLEGLETGNEFLSGQHHYNQDIDLFGEASLFQIINRTGTAAGKEVLAAKLNSNDIEDISGRQEAVKELSEDPDWRQHYQVTASMIQNEVATQDMVDWMKNHKAVIPKMFSWVPLFFGLLSLTIIVLYGIGIVPGRLVLLEFFLGIAISGLYVKKVTGLYAEAGRMKETFSQYSKLIHAIENKAFRSEKLTALQAMLVTNDKDASEVLRTLSKEINNLDQRNNIFFAFLANGFLLWDLRYAYRIEKWIRENEANIEKWFEAVAEFDAWNSLANYAFIRPLYLYPKIGDGDTVLHAKALGHPLLDPEKRVDNDIAIDKGSFFIITGANMAGKSTFLRTVALNLVMANCGLPVCAGTFTYQPIKLISSMRTSDSLKDDESYFFSELKRLKFIVDEIEKDTYFIILDEILKGTNSKDKAEGSQQFVERLVASHSTGLIATHDLSLCVIADQSNEVENHYFDAQIIDDELFFDYKFKEGVCQNMNASFLLKKMGIVNP